MTAPVEVESASINGDEMLAKDAMRATEAGATSVQVLSVGAASEGDRVGGFAAVRKNTCLFAFARGTGEIRDLDLLAFDDGGSVLGADQRISTEPGVVICPPHPRRVYVVARVATGHGLVAVGVQGVAPDDAPGLAIKLDAKLASRGSEALAQAWPGLEGKVMARRDALGGQWEELRKVAVPVTPRAPSYVSAPLLGSRCLDVLVSPNEETGFLDVNLLDDRKRSLVRASNVGEDRVALVCSPVDTTITVAIRPHGGDGLAAVVLSRSAVGGERELAARPDARRVGPIEPLSKVQTRIRKALKAAGYAKGKTTTTGQLAMGRSELRKIEITPGCTRVDVMAGAPLIGVRASLWNASDDLMARDAGGEHVTLFGCASSKVRASLEMNGVGKPGSFAVELRPESAPQELTRHTVAAGRLLGRANAGGRTVRVGAMGKIRALAVSDLKRASFQATIPVRACQDVIAALEPGAVGVEVRAMDMGTGREIASSRGNHVVSAHVCAPARPRRVRVTVSVRMGAATALATLVPAGRLSR